MPDNLSCVLPDGRTLSYAEYGDPQGRPIFCLHGTPGSRLTYASADAPANRLRLRLIAPDRPGCGRSTHLPGWNFDDHMAALAHLADRLELERFAIMGYSGGGPHAAYAARHLRPRIQMLILVNAFATVGQSGLLQRLFLALHHRFKPGLRLAGPTARLLARSETARMMFHFGSSRSDRGAHRKAAIRDWFRTMFQDMPRHGHGLVRDIQLLAQGLPLSAPEEPDIPVWILHGTDDSIVHPDAALHYLRLFPEAFLTLVPAVGHFWGLEDVDAVLNTLDRLLESAR